MTHQKKRDRSNRKKHDGNPERALRAAKEWYRANKPRALSAMREYQKRNPELVKVWHATHERRRRTSGKYAADSARARKRAADDRSAAIAKLGGACLACGFQDERALVFDHRIAAMPRIRNRRREKTREIIALVLAGSSDFDLLCANCNMIKARVNEEYTRRTAEGLAPEQPAAPDPQLPLLH